MPSNPVPNLSQANLTVLARLLRTYAAHIEGEQPLAAQIIHLVLRWVMDDRS